MSDFVTTAIPVRTRTVAHFPDLVAAIVESAQTNGGRSPSALGVTVPSADASKVTRSVAAQLSAAGFRVSRSATPSADETTVLLFWVAPLKPRKPRKPRAAKPDAKPAE